MAKKGTICAIVCPALEDELVYALEHDPDEKKVFIVDKPEAKTIKHKMDQRSMEYQLVDESVLRFPKFDEDSFNVLILMNAMRLHKEPKELKEYIEEQVEMLDGNFDVLALYYGICGNYGWDIGEWAKKRMFETPVTIFRDSEEEVVDDCIAVAVGGRQQYRDLVHNYTGMLFLTPAVATNWDDQVVFENDKEWKDFYASRDDYMRDLFRWGNYEYALKIDTGLGDRELYDSKCEDIVKRLELKIKLPDEPVATVDLADTLYNRSKELLPDRE